MATGTILFQALLTLHLIGLAMGLGGVIVTDFTFVRALRLGDRISAATVTWMRSFSAVIWVGLGILGLSGVGLFLFHPAAYLSNAGFLAKMVFVTVLTANGLLLNFYTTARLTTFNFSEKYQSRGAAWKDRKLSFVFGAISTTTWYATVIIAMFKNIVKLPFYEYLTIYAVVLVFAITASLAMERLISSKYKRQTGTPTIAELEVAPPTVNLNSQSPSQPAVANGVKLVTAQPPLAASAVEPAPVMATLSINPPQSVVHDLSNSQNIPPPNLSGTQA